jgi:hypothetical protein
MSFDVIAIAGRAARAELAWRGADDVLDAIAILPLTIAGDVVAALPIAYAGVARRLAGATSATLVFSDSRMALKGWSPCAVPVSVDVTADRTGEWTWTGALDQEVRKHPPSRLLIDTAIQRREHWWYVPRWVVRLRETAGARAIARRQGAADGVLFVDGGPAPSAHTVAVDDWAAAVVSLTRLDTSSGPPPSAGPAVLFGHDFSIPDQERTSRVALHGMLDGPHLTVSRREGDLQLPAPRLLDRLRAHYRLERACRRALSAYDASAAAT